MLLAIRNLLQDRGQASLTDLSLHFRTSPEAMRGMVEHWVAKGQVCRLSCAGSACSRGCGSCSAAPELYCWVRPKA